MVRIATSLALLGILAPGDFTAAQNATRSAIRGRVTDASGNVMPGVGLIARPASGGPLRRFTTRAGGQFELSGLAPGDYDVFAFLDSFDTSRLNGRYSVNVPAGHHELSATYPGHIARARDVSVVVGKKVDLPLSALATGGRSS